MILIPLFQGIQVEIRTLPKRCKEGDKRLKRRRNKHYQTGSSYSGFMIKAVEPSLFSKELAALYESLVLDRPKVARHLTEFSLQAARGSAGRIAAPSRSGQAASTLSRLTNRDTGPFGGLFGIRALWSVGPSQKQPTVLCALYRWFYRPWADVLAPSFSLKDEPPARPMGSYYTPYPLVKQTVAALQDVNAHWHTDRS